MNRASLDIYDKSFGGIDHYRQYPAMLPYVGSHYISPGHPKVLLLGESNYLPEYSTIHKDIDKWYSGSQNLLTEEEVEWVHNRHLLECDWKWPGHEIYREINRCIAEVIKISPNDRALTHVAYINAFQRPAIAEGASFKDCCTNKDIKVASSVINSVVSILQPEAVIFLSKFAWDSIGSGISILGKANYYFTCHPTAYFYWNRSGYGHGRKKFLDLLTKIFYLHCTEGNQG